MGEIKKILVFKWGYIRNSTLANNFLSTNNKQLKREEDDGQNTSHNQLKDEAETGNRRFAERGGG